MWGLQGSPCPESRGSPRVLALLLLSGGGVEQHCCQPRFQPTHQRPWSGSPSSTYQLCNLELITSPLRAPFSSSCCCLLAPLRPNLKDCSLLGPLSLGFPGKNIGVGCYFLLQGIFPTQGSNSSLLLGRWILYHLSNQGPFLLLLESNNSIISVHLTDLAQELNDTKQVQRAAQRWGTLEAQRKPP